MPSSRGISRDGADAYEIVDAGRRTPLLVAQCVVGDIRHDPQQPRFEAAAAVFAHGAMALEQLEHDARLAAGDVGRGGDVGERRAVALERGAATVVAVALTGVLLLIGAAAGVVGAIVVAHRRAQAAADLAALAGAAVVQHNATARELAAAAAPKNHCGSVGSVGSLGASGYSCVTSMIFLTSSSPHAVTAVESASTNKIFFMDISLPADMPNFLRLVSPSGCRPIR